MSPPQEIQDPFFKSGKKNIGHLDGSDLLANKFGLYIDLYSIIAGKRVAFKGFLESYQDSFDAQTESHTFVGHPQPYRKQKSIERSVKITLTVPAVNIFQAKLNLSNVSLLAKMMHPLAAKDQSGGVTRYTVVAGGDPVFKVRFLNLLSDMGAASENLAAASIAKTSGVRGFIDDLNYEFVLDGDGGGFLTNPEEKGFIYPKLIRLSFTFFPFESISPLWVIGDNGEVEFSRKSFPYAFKGISGELEGSDIGAKSNTVDGVNRARINKALDNIPGISWGPGLPQTEDPGWG